MTQAVSGNISVGLAMTLAQAVGLASGAAPVNYKISQDFANGSGANKASQMWSSSARSIAASSNEALDLSGSLTDAFGNSIAFTKVRAILVKAAATNVNDVLVGGAAANGFISMFGDATDVLKVKPGGTVLIMAPDVNGLAVVAATADQLKVANGGSGTAVLYDIVIIGE